MRPHPRRKNKDAPRMGHPQFHPSGPAKAGGRLLQNSVYFPIHRAAPANLIFILEKCSVSSRKDGVVAGKKRARGLIPALDTPVGDSLLFTVLQVSAAVRAVFP